MPNSHKEEKNAKGEKFRHWQKKRITANHTLLFKMPNLGAHFEGDN